jgi:SAM-dependent methyltransferase
MEVTKSQDQDKMNITHMAGPETQNAEAQNGLTESALGEANEAEETPAQHTNPGSVISGLSIDQNWDADSAVGTERESSTNSLRSSIYAYVEENGRRYHKYKEGKYYFPNDEVEQDRLDLQHHLCLLTLDGKLALAPIQDMPGGIHNVLDIGTGTGIWAIDFASSFPSADVIGTDLSPIQPAFVPPNCRFEVEDAEDEWIYSHKFDYIHGRMLASCFSSHVKVFESAFNFLRPGGWFEMQDFAFPLRCIDDTMKGTAFERWLELILAGCEKLGKDLGRAPIYEKYMRDIGFVDVQQKLVAWPIGSWPKDEKMKVLGAWCKEDVLSGLNGSSMAILTRGLGMTTEEVEILLMEVRQAINSRRLHCYIPM